MDHREIKVALGLTDANKVHPKWGYPLDTKVPPHVSTDWITIQGVEVCYLSSYDARKWWGKKGMAMRVIAKCPDCGKITAASRINQHARVHYAGVRKGY